MIENVEANGLHLAIILRTQYESDGITFFTPDTYSQQLGYMRRPAGYVIPPHVHIPVKREVHFTKEFLYIKSGVVRVDFYDESETYLRSSILRQGDVILLVFGGHGFEILEEAEIIEVKQGPYAGDQDKRRFTGIAKEQLILGTY